MKRNYTYEEDKEIFRRLYEERNNPDGHNANELKARIERLIRNIFCAMDEPLGKAYLKILELGCYTRRMYEMMILTVATFEVMNGLPDIMSVYEDLNV